MEVLEIRTVFSLSLFNYTIPITETVIVSWIVMFILVAASVILTHKLKEVPKGSQVFLEAGVEFLNGFAKKQFGSFSKNLGPYMGSLFLFVFMTSVISVFSPVEIKFFGHVFTPLFTIHPPTRDINVTAALALISILLILVSGFSARGIKGWFKHLLHPLPVMLPFNLMEYGTRLLSLALRLFGNVMGSAVMMRLIAQLFPLVLPMIFALYFELFDSLIQAGIFVFLTSLYISEAVKVNGE